MLEVTKKAPAIRFKGFSDAWEQRKFSNIVNRVSQQSNDSNLPKVEFEDIISGEGRLNKDISSKFDGRKGTVFEPEFILYGKLRPYLKNWLFPNFKGIALGDFWVFEPNNSSSIFDYYLIQSDKYQTVANLSSGTKMPRSDWKTVSETEFSIPVNIEEQVKIGNFFKHLDDTIALHQRKLTLLEQLKQTYLQVMFPQGKESIPKLRFTDHSEPWEQRKLGEVGLVVMCKRIFKDQTTAFGDIPFYKIGTFGSSPDSFIPNELFEEYKKNYPYPEIGDILMSASGTIGRTVVYEGEKAYYQDSNIVWLKTEKSLIDNSFLKQFYQVVKWSGLEGSTIKRLYNSNILSTGINLPSLREQTKLGTFFNQIDNTIALHQEKIAHLKVLKSTLLNKMFI